jgi:hypothetical protein
LIHSQYLKLKYKYKIQVSKGEGYILGPKNTKNKKEKKYNGE